MQLGDESVTNSINYNKAKAIRLVCGLIGQKLEIE